VTLRILVIEWMLTAMLVNVMRSLIIRRIVRRSLANNETLVVYDLYFKAMPKRNRFFLSNARLVVLKD